MQRSFDTLVAYIHQQPLLDVVRQVVREELRPSSKGGLPRRSAKRAKNGPSVNSAR